MDNYFEYTREHKTDLAKQALNLPVCVPIFKLAYTINGQRKYINLFPTLQFLYSHHIHGEYITNKVKDQVHSFQEDGDISGYCARFLKGVHKVADADSDTPTVPMGPMGRPSQDASAQLGVEVLTSYIRQNPQYTLAALSEGCYIIGMKDQFNMYASHLRQPPPAHTSAALTSPSRLNHPLACLPAPLFRYDLPMSPFLHHIEYIADENGFVLYCKEGTAMERSIDSFGPYYVEQYLLMEVLSKQEVAQNVLDYYVNRKEKLQQGVQRFDEAQGKGFICWRFIDEFRSKEG